MWTIFVDVSIDGGEPSIAVFDDQKGLLHQGPSLFKALAYVHEYGGAEFMLEAPEGAVSVLINFCHDMKEMGLARNQPLPKAIEWLHPNAPNSPLPEDAHRETYP